MEWFKHSGVRLSGLELKVDQGAAPARLHEFSMELASFLNKTEGLDQGLTMLMVDAVVSFAKGHVAATKWKPIVNNVM